MLEKTIEINKKLLPAIQKQKLDKGIKMRIMKRVGELKNELNQMNTGGEIKDEETSIPTPSGSEMYFLCFILFSILDFLLFFLTFF